MRNPIKELESDLLPLRTTFMVGMEHTARKILGRAKPGFRMDNAFGLALCRKLISMKDKDILEVGGRLPKDLALSTGCKSWLATDIKESTVHEGPRYFTGCEDATNLSFEANSFDIVFSIAALEHIPSPADCLREVCRVLRPGGYFFSTFGPIWSGPIGNHTKVIHDGKVMNYRQGVMEPWEHLIYPRDELLARRTARHGAEIAEKAIASSWNVRMNHVMCDQHLAAIQASGMYVNYLVKRTCGTIASDEQLAELRRLHPTNTDFDTNGIRFLLQKPL